MLKIDVSAFNAATAALGAMLWYVALTRSHGAT